ncbi:MAG: M16 family metallopeptidase [Dermatophilaceae bacterium]
MSPLPPPPALPRPQVTPPGAYTFPVATRHTLGNGLTVVAYDLPGQYVHAVRMAVPLPLRLEPREVEGVASLMARTLDEGTARYSSAEFVRLLERRGVAYAAGMSDSGLGVEMEVAKGNLGYALDLLRQTLTEAAFPQDQVERHVKTRLAEIELERSVAAQRAAVEFSATFFDSSTRGARPTGGTAETVSAVSREDVVSFHARHVAPAEATIVVAGDLLGMDVFHDVEAALGGWHTPGGFVTPGPWQPAAVANDRARVVVVDRPGSVQTEILIGCPGPDRHVDGGWAPFPVLGFVIGGSPTARVDAVLREEKGYTYGIRSGFRPRRKGGLFFTSGSVRADVTVESVDLLLGILDGARDGFTPEETRQGADFIAKTAPGRFATADAIADEAVGLVYDGLTTEFTTALNAEIRDIDHERLGTAYRRFVDGSWTVVLVGDAQRFVDGVRALGRGDVTVLSN